MGFDIPRVLYGFEFLLSFIDVHRDLIAVNGDILYALSPSKY